MTRLSHCLPWENSSEISWYFLFCYRFFFFFPIPFLIFIVQYLTSTACVCLPCSLCDILAVIKPESVSGVTMTFVFRSGSLANVCEGGIWGKGWCFGAVKPSLWSCQGCLAFAMSLSCVLCYESPTSRRAHLLCKHYLSRCVTAGTQWEEEGNVKTSWENRATFH